MNKIQQVGIIGSGKMGSDIFNYLSEFNHHFIWFTRNSEHREILHETFRKKVNRQLKHGIISKEIFDLRNNYRITTHLNDLSDCDLIIETVIEEQQVKNEIIKQLDLITKPSCIITSNSSSILPSQLGQEIKRKNRLAGIHFFYPLAFKNIIELIFSDSTDELTRESLRLFAGTIKKNYIEQSESNAFILNRFLLQIQIKAFEIVKEYKINYKQVDEIAKQVIPDFGLFEMMDQVGHNTMYNAVMNYSLMDSDKKKYEPIVNELLHRKHGLSGQGNYLFYNEAKHDVIISESIQKEILKKISEHTYFTFNQFSKEFQINSYALKKALHEFCGIIL